MKFYETCLILFLSLSFLAFSDNENDDLKKKAEKLAHEVIIIDTHIDTPLILRRNWVNISESFPGASFDYPRAKAGGLDLPFFAVYVSPSTEFNGAFGKADTLIDVIKSCETEWPDKFKVVESVQDVLDNSTSGKILIALGMENGSPIEGKIENVKYFYDRGIRYITLAHGKWNHLSDSSYDPEKKWNGISPFGEEVIQEMNRLGIMVDVSHLSDSAFYDVMRISSAPVIASHSSCRYFTPGLERNMNDEMIKELASKGGVIMINFGSMFIDSTINNHYNTRPERLEKAKKENDIFSGTPEEKEFEKIFLKNDHPGYADVSDVANHIDHVVKIAGVDYVGIGSDFDGLGDALPTGLKDVSGYPNLIYELLKLGYSDEDIKKICSDNLLRVWKQVEEKATKPQKK